MANTRKPAALKLLKGDNKVHNVRWLKQHREEEIRLQEASGPLDPTPPDYLNPKQRACYEEIYRRAHKDVLCTADGPLLEFVACTLTLCRTKQWRVHPNMLGKLMAALVQLGMTPAARGKVAPLLREKDKKGNPLNEFST